MRPEISVENNSIDDRPQTLIIYIKDMKTKIALSILTICLMTSFKKDRICECTYLRTVNTVTYHDTKHNAKKKCAALQQTLIETFCKLK